jgi:glucose-1-phosphate thymidylyltransferase
LKGIVLHGGAGTRLRPLTHTGPKQLIPIANKPVSQYAVEDLLACGIKHIAFILGDVHPEKVKEYYGDGSRFNAKFEYVFQGDPRGIAQAVGLCKDFIGNSNFIVYLGDNLIKGGIKKFASEFESQQPSASILLAKVKDPSRFGIATLDANGKIIGLEEKPKNPKSNLALTGIYMFQPIIFDIIDRLKPSWRNELEITDAIQSLLSEGGEIIYHVVEGWWKDTGTPKDILESNRLALDEIQSRMDGMVEDGGLIQGRVDLGTGSMINNGATVRGPTIIGKNARIESGVYVGPYTSIGNNVTIRRGEIEDSIVMDNCTIDIPDRITSSIIGQHSTITSENHKSPRGLKLTVGENCQIII